MSPFPGEFIRFIGVCEVLGAIGLILPYALRILPGLTALAAAGSGGDHGRGHGDDAGDRGWGDGAAHGDPGAARRPRGLWPAPAE